ncbi:hypothetical protein [Bacterioplanoides sp.]|uniref:hypothetical protein n=1 Tax=Bacterioplanoides sp. TaxID=2066072 RepID=UPI003B00575C
MRFISACLLFFSVASHAETPQETLELLSYRLSSSFDAFVFFEGQQQYLSQVNNLLQQGENLLNQSPENHGQLQQQWQQAKTLISNHHDSENTQNTNNLDLLETEWTLLNSDIQQQIDQLKQPSYSSAKVELQVELEKILSQYMQHSTASLGGFSALPGQDPMEEGIKRVDTLLASDFSDNQQLQRKWRFIRRPLLTYNTNSMPFIVLKVFDDMRQIIRT